MNIKYPDLFSLEGKTAVVIGGTGELCGAMATGMAMAGAKVVLVGRSEAKAKQRIEQIDSLTAPAKRADFLTCDVSSKPNIEQLLQHVLELHSKVDIVVNGAGVNSSTPFLDISEAEFDSIIGLNLKSLLFGCQVFGQYFIDRQVKGTIINLGSMSAIHPLSRVFTYSASKAGVHNLTKNLAREWGPHGIRVNTLVPGFFPAEQNRKVLTKDRIESILNHTPMNRFGDPHELIGATLLLASDAGSFINGSELVVDGGFAVVTI